MTFAEASDEARDALDATTAQTVAVIGDRVRQLRRVRNLTLQQLAEASRLSPSMLSLVERGRSAPSLASLVAIANALRVNLTELIATEAEIAARNPVTRFEEQPLIQTGDHVVRRLMLDDPARGVFAFHSEYRPNSGTTLVAAPSQGPERAIYGVVLEGELTVGVDGVDYILRRGDFISYGSLQSHRIWNHSGGVARALWFNLRISEQHD